MSKPQMLVLEPANELRFNGPFTEVITSHLKLTNTTEKTVNFKVKTTAPRFYCVRPNSGQVQPGASVKVSVMLQPVEQPQVLEKERSRHKFMVQSAVANEEPVDAFWKTVDPAKVTDGRLKVVFGNIGTEGGPNETDVAGADTFGSLNNTAKGDESKPRRQESPIGAPKQASLVHRVPPADYDSSSQNRNNEQIRKLTLEKEELKHKLTQLTLHSADSGQLLNVQTILVVLAALLIGIILGKLF